MCSQLALHSHIYPELDLISNAINRLLFCTKIIIIIDCIIDFSPPIIFDNWLRKFFDFPSLPNDDSLGLIHGLRATAESTKGDFPIPSLNLNNFWFPFEIVNSIQLNYFTPLFKWIFQRKYQLAKLFFHLLIYYIVYFAIRKCISNTLIVWSTSGDNKQCSTETNK